MAKLRIAVTAGEPAGIGPDLVLALAQRQSAEAEDVEIVAIGDPDLLAQRAELLHCSLAGLNIEPVQLAVPSQPGILNPDNARYVLNTLEEAVAGCQAGRYDAMVTAPVQKSVINDAGIPFSGHTEFLQELTQADQVVMMLATEQMRVALVTTHLPLSEVPAAITAGLLRRVCQVLWQDLRQRFAIEAPRIAVLGLNPHAGEGGHLGREELEVIIPTLESLRSEGMNLLGPLPADTAFNKKVLSQCDVVLAMYHDQGLPVLKYAGFGNAVNVTLGLPIVRTSVDHGTALDLAGSGQADSGSLLYAIDVAAQMARARAA
jgi:4-hydroxythreonine-4-phosphate dehydrogenase